MLVTTTRPPDLPSKIPAFVVGELLPDFISHRALPLMGRRTRGFARVFQGFNVASISAAPTRWSAGSERRGSTLAPPRLRWLSGADRAIAVRGAVPPLNTP